MPMVNLQPPHGGSRRVTMPDTDETRPMALAWKTYYDKVLAEWYSLLSDEPEEEAVQNFLELHPSMIPGGSGDVGPGGHHGSDIGGVFRRPRLIGEGRTFEPDFMWVTRSTSLITPILIEIEKPSKRWFRKDGRPTSQFSEAHDQLSDWRSWFAREGNLSLFRQTFLLLKEEWDHRPLEPQYLLIYGRESEFQFGGGHLNPRALRYKRDQQRGASGSFMTFDSLRPRFDHSNSMTLTMTALGPKIHAFSPVFGTGPHVRERAFLLGDPCEALNRSVMMSPARREYLAQRWSYWQRYEQGKKANPNGLYTYQPGIE